MNWKYDWMTLSKKCRLHRGVCPVELHFLFEVNRMNGQRTRMLKLTLHFYSICLLCSGTRARIRPFENTSAWFAAISATILEISSDLVEISSDLVEISSELVRISSELVFTISELLKISAFIVYTKSECRPPVGHRNLTFADSVCFAFIGIRICLLKSSV